MPFLETHHTEQLGRLLWSAPNYSLHVLQNDSFFERDLKLNNFKMYLMYYDTKFVNLTYLLILNCLK